MKNSDPITLTMTADTYEELIELGDVREYVEGIAAKDFFTLDYREALEEALGEFQLACIRSEDDHAEFSNEEYSKAELMEAYEERTKEFRKALESINKVVSTLYEELEEASETLDNPPDLPSVDVIDKLEWLRLGLVK